MIDREDSTRYNCGAIAVILFNAVVISSACTKPKPKSKQKTPRLTVSTVPDIGRIRWRTPEDLIQIGFSRSRVVMMNEAHSGLLRSIRTREIGRRLLLTAHRVGVRCLAMEALGEKTAAIANKVRKIPWGSQDYFEEGYLAQPEMQAFIQTALDLNWTLVGYEQQQRFQEGNREKDQGHNLTMALNSLPPRSKMLVWCGNSHHYKMDRGEQSLMGHYFWKESGIEPFVIDQTQSIIWPHFKRRSRKEITTLVEDLKRMGVTEAGFLVEESPPKISWELADAFIISTQNNLE